MLNHFVVFLSWKKVPILGVIYYVKAFLVMFLSERKCPYFGCHLFMLKKLFCDVFLSKRSAFFRCHFYYVKNHFCDVFA
jgi:hypothetical protein